MRQLIIWAWYIWVIVRWVLAIIFVLAAAWTFASILAKDVGWELAIVIVGTPIAILLLLFLRQNAVVKARQTIIINRPIANVFSFLADDYFVNRIKWAQLAAPNLEYVSSQQDPEGNARLGTKRFDTLQQDRQTAEWTYEVTEYNPRVSFGVRERSKPGSITGHNRMLFRPTESGTRVETRVEQRHGLSFGLIMLLWAPYHQEKARKELQTGVENMKLVAEREIAPVVSDSPSPARVQGGTQEL